jgi:hypothetical protein
MKTRAESREAWQRVRCGLNECGIGATARLPKASFPHPRDAGARLTTTWPVGQMADYAIDGGQGEPPIVIREFDDHYEAMIDGVRLGAHAVELSERSPTAAMYLGGALLGGAIGASVSNKREAVVVGTGLGLLFAVLLGAGLEDVSRRRGK